VRFDEQSDAGFEMNVRPLVACAGFGLDIGQRERKLCAASDHCFIRPQARSPD